MTAEWFRDEILEAYVCFFKSVVGLELNSTDHNARSYRSSLVNELLKSRDIRLMICLKAVLLEEWN